jgi:RNA polymerase sigma-70 factor (ECF subfamily)
LKPDEQNAVIGRVELGYTYEELAEALDKPSAEAARKAAQRALVRLAEEMERGRK